MLQAIFTLIYPKSHKIVCTVHDFEKNNHPHILLAIMSKGGRGYPVFAGPPSQVCGCAGGLNFKFAQLEIRMSPPVVFTDSLY